MAVVRWEGGSTCLDWEEGPISQTNPKLCEGSVLCCHTADLAGSFKKQEQERPKGRSLQDTAGGGEGQGRAIVDADSERTLCEEGLNPFDDFTANDVGS